MDQITINKNYIILLYPLFSKPGDYISPIKKETKLLEDVKKYIQEIPENIEFYEVKCITEIIKKKKKKIMKEYHSAIIERKTLREQPWFKDDIKKRLKEMGYLKSETA